MRNILCIAAVALVGSMVPASAGITTLNPGSTTPGTNNSGSSNSGGSKTSGNTPSTPPTYTRTFLFPPVGLAATESARIAAANIAKASHNGTAASCSGTISFTNASGAPVGTATDFKNLATGNIAHGDVLGVSPSSPPGTVRNEYQGSVQVTITPGSSAPCSLLLTLEVFDTTTGVTHGLITSAIDEPLEFEPISAGRH